MGHFLRKGSLPVGVASTKIMAPHGWKTSKDSSRTVYSETDWAGDTFRPSQACWGLGEHAFFVEILAVVKQPIPALLHKESNPNLFQLGKARGCSVHGGNHLQGVQKKTYTGRLYQSFAYTTRAPIYVCVFGIHVSQPWYQGRVIFELRNPFNFPKGIS